MHHFLISHHCYQQARNVRFEQDPYGTQRRARKSTASSAIGSVLSSAISNMSAISQYSTMSRYSRSHRSRRGAGRHRSKLNNGTLNQMESQSDFQKYNSLPLGQLPPRKNPSKVGGHNVAPSLVGSRMSDILPEHAADAVRFESSPITSKSFRYHFLTFFVLTERSGKGQFICCR